MPHIIAEYSANLEPGLDVRGLVDDLHAVAAAAGVADLPAIRTRAERRDIFRVGDGSAKNGFVHVVARLRVGRPADTLKALADGLLAAVEARLAPVYASHAVATTVEIHEINHLTVRRNTVRETTESAA